MPIVLAEPQNAAGGYAVTNQPQAGLKKGTKITVEDCGRLTAAGVQRLEVAFYADDAYPEQQAAREIAAAISTETLETRLKTGCRVDFSAVEAGKLFYDARLLAKFNVTVEQVSLACLPCEHVVEKNQIVGTLKVNPFAISRETMSKARACASELILAVKAWQPMAVELVSCLEDERGLQKLQSVLQTRCRRLGASLRPHRSCPDSGPQLVQALTELQSTSADAVLIVASRSAYGRDDVLPQAIAAAGRLERHGLPVEPGNLITVGALNGRGIPVIGLSRCCFSAARTAVDLLLEQLACGGELSSAWLGGLGNRGYLK